MELRSLRAVVMSEEAKERRALVKTLENLPGIKPVAEVDLLCQMGNQAGHVEADYVFLDIDRYPRAGTLSLLQAQATFPEAYIIVLARSIDPRFPSFLKEHGASCCIDKDSPHRLTQLINTLRLTARVGQTHGEYRRVPPRKGTATNAAGSREVRAPFRESL